MPAGRKIQLVRTPQEVTNPYVSLGFRFTVQAQNGNLMPNQIFKVVNRPIDPANPSVVTVAFLGVCTPGDLINLLATTPAEFTDIYRVALIDVTYDSETAAEDAWTAIKTNTTSLVAALNATDVLASPETVQIGPLP